MDLMIANTLPNTKKATCSVLVPNFDPQYQGFPTPYGTGFFVSSDGFFVTARHVLYNPSQTTMLEIPKIIVTKPELMPSMHVTNLKLIKEWVNFDLALLKADYNTVRNQDLFKEKAGFDYLEVDFEMAPEGSDVYSFGYPLPQIRVQAGTQMIMGFSYDCPRTTSAIISSHYDVIGSIRTNRDPQHYVIDKALNYGNSGGPLILQQNGKAIAVISRFQPVNVPQRAGATVMIPSLYGIASSLKNIENEIKGLVNR